VSDPGEPGRAPRDHDTEPIPVIGEGQAGRDQEPASEGDARGVRRWLRLGAGEGPGWPTLVAAGVAAVLLVLLAANAWLASSTEDRIAEQIEDELAIEPEVTLSGFPTGLRALFGRVGEAEIRAREVPVPGLGTTLTELELTLTDVRLDRDAEELTAERATFAVVLDSASLEGLLPVIGQLPEDLPLLGDVSELVEIELGDGVATLRVVGFAVVDATAEIRNGELILAPGAPLAQLGDISIAVDELPLGFAVDDVRIRPEGLRLEGSAAPFAIEDVDP